MRNARRWIAGTVLAAVAGALLMSGSSGAGEGKALRDSVDKITAALKSGDKDAAKKEAEALAKKMDDVAAAMDLFKPRKKDGIGVGEKPGAILPDGIEQMLIKIGRDAPSGAMMKKDGGALEQMGYHVAALGLVAAAKPPAKFVKGQTAKEWKDWSTETIEAGLALAAAAKAKGAGDVKGAAAKLNSACNSCHTKFR